MDISALKYEAQGRWGSILTALAPSLQDALARHPRHVPCPVHGGSDGFRLYADYEDTGGGVCNTCGAFHDGFALLQWANGWVFKDALQAVVAYLQFDERRPVVSRPRPKPQPPKRDKKAILAIHTMWQQSHPRSPRVGRYLASRGLSGDVPASLRGHPGLPYVFQDGEITYLFPGMVAPVQSPTGEVVALHRTYLSPDNDGKAPVKPAKKLTKAIYPGATKGAAIRLAPLGVTVNVTEGIETGVAVMELTGLPTLAAVSAGGLERFIPPAPVREVNVYADNDANGRGQEAAARLRERLLRQGFECVVYVAPLRGRDWCDLAIV